MANEQKPITVQKKLAKDEQAEYDTLNKVVCQEDKITKRLQRYRRDEKQAA